MEQEQSQLTALMSTPEYHRQSPDKMRTDGKRLEEIETLLQTKYSRWEALEELRGRVA